MKNVKNITKHVVNILNSTDKVTYKRVSEYIQNHRYQIWLVVENDEPDVFITYGLNENINCCMPTEHITKDLLEKLNFALRNIITNKNLKINIIHKKYNLVYYLDTNEYDIMTTQGVETYKHYVRTKGYAPIKVIRPLYLDEVLDNSKIREMKGEETPLF